jgi:multidrug efflux pump subunit AcrB
MWIVRVALSRPYTFVVLALLILILSPIVIERTPTDIFPAIDIPVIAAVWNYTGLNTQEMEGYVTSQFERIVTTAVNNVEHIESLTVNGRSIIKVFLQPGASVDEANSQITAAAQVAVRHMPPGTTAPFILTYNASTVPILQLALSSDTLSEQELNDLGLNFLRTQLITIPGTMIPYPYGGKQKQIMVSLNPRELQAKGLSAADVVTALGDQNLILPTGQAKIGPFQYDVGINSSPETVAALNNLPLKVVGNSTIYIRDVATVSDGFAPQTNIVRLNGTRGTLLTIMKSGNASTLDVVSNIRKALPRIESTLPRGLKIAPLADQSVFVRAAIQGVVREAIIAAALTGLMILLFLGSWRSTLIIAVSIPLSILSSVLILSALGQTINTMTLGGLALAVGILVDDATVAVENINRNLDMGKDLIQAILDGSQQIALPAFVSTLCICIVFLPMFFLSGVAKYMFVPLAEAVVFAMLASYFWSRTIVPTMAKYLLRLQHHGARTYNPFVLFQRLFERGFERVRVTYQLLLTSIVYRRAIFVPVFLLFCLAPFALLPWLGQDFFPSSDSGQFRLHVRARTGTRIEETARLCDLVEHTIRGEIPPRDLGNILDNIGLPYSGINTTYNNSGVVGTADADILVSLKPDHRPTADYVRSLRASLNRDYPDTTFYFLPADMISQILDFGLPAPIDIQIEGANAQANRMFADRLLAQVRQVPGLTDLRIQQPFDQPMLQVAVDRTKAAADGVTQRDIAASLLVSLSGSFQTTPTFWLSPQNGVNYSVVVQSPEYDMQSFQDVNNIPITASGMKQPLILGDVATISRTSGPALINHYNIRRVVDIYGSVEGRDLGGAGADVSRIVNANRKYLPRGSFVSVRGELEAMDSSYRGLLAGLAFAIVLVYFLIVVNFQSWLDPLIIISALPAALAGIIVFLFIVHTRLSVPALMGAIMCMGVATANSILVVSFAKERLEEHGDAVLAAVEAGYTRFRPVWMTALAMIIGMVPMALGIGEGGEQNAPLGRAVIGGLACATIATLVFVPAVFSLLHRGGRPAEAAPELRTGMRPVHE